MRLFLAALALFAFDLSLALYLPEREASAGTALRLDLPDLVHGSELVVEGRVLSQHPLEQDGLLLTESLIEVARTFKGADESYRAVRLPGGVRADGSGLLVPGMPSLAPGEDVLLFLSAEGATGLRMPTGLAQGKLAVQRLPGGAKRLAGDLSALALVDEDGAHAQRGGTLVLDYAECVAAIEAALNAEARDLGR